MAQILDTLSKGVMTQGIGSVSITAAETVSSVYKYYQTNKNNALFNYGILIYGNERSVEDITSKIYGHLTFDASKAPSLKIIDLSNTEVSDRNNFISLPWITSELLLQSDRNSQIWSYNTGFNNFYRIPYIITAEEATEFFRLPIGTQRLSPGLPINHT